MAERSGFFNAQQLSDGSYDRTYNASDFADFFASFIKSGVYADPINQLKVVQKSGLTVTVKAGKAFIDGYYYELDEDKDITFSANATSYLITNAVALTLDKTERKISLKKKEQMSIDKPTNTGTIHELILCTIKLSPATSIITDSIIVDRRPDDNYCGFVAGLIEQINFGELFSQMESQFNDWFNDIKGKLSGDVATNLQNQINELPTIRSGTAEPDNSVGKDGDIYIKIVT